MLPVSEITPFNRYILSTDFQYFGRPRITRVVYETDEKNYHSTISRNLRMIPDGLEGIARGITETPTTTQSNVFPLLPQECPFASFLIQSKNQQRQPRHATSSTSIAYPTDRARNSPISRGSARSSRSAPEPERSRTKSRYTAATPRERRAPAAAPRYPRFIPPRASPCRGERSGEFAVLPRGALE